MQHGQKWLEYLPFPLVITNACDCIEHYNFLFARLAGADTVGVDVKNVFDRWTPEESFLVSVTLHNHPYVLLHQSIVLEEQPYTLYIVADTTQVQLLREQVANLETQLEAVMESSNDGIYITDNEGVTLKVNSAIEKMTGYPKHCFVGHNVADLVKEGTLKRSITLKVLEERKRVDYVYQLDEKKAFATGIPIFKENGEIDKVVTNVRNLTEVNHFYNELQRAFELSNKYRRELDLLKAKLKSNDPDVVIESKQMVGIYDMAERVADVDATVLILGETGVGKDVLARHLYAASQRSRNGEFIKVNCGAIPHDLLESELFGYEAGAFTGANKTGKPGMFELADKGMLFLDEVGELPLALQVKLLRVLQEKEIQRIGATRSKRIDVRLIAATNRDLKQMVACGTFREDLFYRLNVLPIAIPPLRERKEDIVPLAQFVLEKLNRKYKTNKSYDETLERFFCQYKWPGNVRELTNLVERMVLTVPSSVMMEQDLPDEYNVQDGSRTHAAQELNRVMTLKEAAEIAEREILALAVQKFQSTYKMAEELGTSQATIVRKLKKYKL